MKKCREVKNSTKKHYEIKQNRAVRGSNATFIVEFDGISTAKVEDQEDRVSGFDAEKLPL